MSNYERILYTTVTEQYIDKGQEIDWEKVAGRVVRFGKEQCKTRFYQLQRQLTDRTSSKGSVWSRREIDRLCAGAHKAEQASLKKNSDSKGSDGSGSRHVDWTVIAKEFAPKRSPDECKRIYSDYRHLSRFNIGWRKYQSKIRTLVSAVIFLACISFYTRLVDVVYDYIEGEETIDIKVPKEQEI
ncbi:hypothetical protein LPJ72_002788 [Coemansia sp. Benny D160-2]|nr:hypothetical protein LPJ72_002788 [Coemansia sp. Benny D160-2]